MYVALDLAARGADVDDDTSDDDVVVVADIVVVVVDVDVVVAITQYILCKITFTGIRSLLP